MTNKYKKSGSFDKEYFVKPRIVFDEVFEKQIAAGIPSTRLGKYLEKLKAGRYGKYTRFVLNHKYAFSYGIVGILIFGFIIGLICAGFGWFVDRAMDRRMAFNQERSEKDEQYKKYRHTFLVNEYSLLADKIFGRVAIALLFYGVALSVCSEIPRLYIPLMSWYKFTEPLTIKMSSFIPAIGSYEKYLAEAGRSNLVWRVSHNMSVSWFAILLPFPLFITYCLYLIRNFNSWSYNIEQYKANLPKELCKLILAPIGIYVFLDAFFFGEKWEFILESPFYLAVTPIVCVAIFVATCAWLVTITKIIKINK